MRKLILVLCISLFSITMNAQLSKAEVESYMSGVNLSEMTDVFLIRTRMHDGASKGWFEKFEKLDAKTCKITLGANSLFIEGASYSTLLPYDKIKIIFAKKKEFLSIELEG